ncbi:hypothetical protein MTR_8g442610 [Medicago truncatula]|uniref:Uncharacterized protein n=1 Tax=Medicago truncatula TaxID=3880 RepID=A0A072TPM6_MEDTR|nr:hypothetical protein MTR_8g442610 [Medicago truncatula]
MSSEGRNDAIDGSLEYEDDEIIDSLTTVPEPQHGPLPQANHIDDGVLYEGKTKIMKWKVKGNGSRQDVVVVLNCW